MTADATTKLIDFRTALYALFPKRKAAIMNLLDALSSYGHRCKSVVELSTAPCFKRQYSSITDAIADGLPDADWQKIRSLIYQLCTGEANHRNKFILDCTPNPRPHAEKLADRYVTHAPNPAPGNKPICVGHQYSVLVGIPLDETAKGKHWVMPLCAKMVPSTEKGNEFGMQQLIHYIEELEIEKALNISVADSLYGTNKCREIAISKENLVHIFRLRNNRNVYLQPPERSSRRGRIQEYGDKISLQHLAEQTAPSEEVERTVVARKNRTHTVTIKCWQDILLRGTKDFRSGNHPINIVQVVVTNEQDKSVFKKPLWLAVLGERRHELTALEVQQTYAERYDIEHFFRFGKNNLLMNGYQTSDIEHEQLWWQLCSLAYIQLYLAKEIVPSLPQPWERYLPDFKSADKLLEQLTSSPSKTQKGLNKLLEAVGTPAAACIPRGNPIGRQAGDIQVKREKQDIHFKTKKENKKKQENIVSASELNKENSNSKEINDLINLVLTKLENSKITPEEFLQLFTNSS